MPDGKAIYKDMDPKPFMKATYEGQIAECTGIDHVCSITTDTELKKKWPWTRSLASVQVFQCDAQKAPINAHVTIPARGTNYLPTLMLSAARSIDMPMYIHAHPCPYTFNLGW
eukprot:1145081-Pelagomonas_calceolata.AAC.2